MSKALRQGKIIDPRLIYISWLHGKEDDGRTCWVRMLHTKLTAETQTQKLQFPREPWRTGDDLPGDLVALAEPKTEVTDMICALSDSYLIANQKGSSSDDAAELAEFIGIKKTFDTKDRQRVWLAPLTKLRYRNHRIADTELADEGIFWLHRLKKDEERFQLPYPQVNLGDVDDDIFVAVKTVLGEPDD